MNWICLGLVALSYAVGHMSGYKLCKLRVKNVLRKNLSSSSTATPWMDPTGVQQVLTEVVKL